MLQTNDITRQTSEDEISGWLVEEGFDPELAEKERAAAEQEESQAAAREAREAGDEPADEGVAAEDGMTGEPFAADPEYDNIPNDQREEL